MGMQVCCYLRCRCVGENASLFLVGVQVYVSGDAVVLLEVQCVLVRMLMCC